MAERINSRIADPVVILAARILDVLANRTVECDDQHALVYARPKSMHELYHCMHHHRYGDLWHRAFTLCKAKGAVKITIIKTSGRPKMLVSLVHIPPTLVAHRKPKKARRRRPQTEWFRVNILGEMPSVGYVPGDPLARR